jgi:hypothetical protein
MRNKKFTHMAWSCFKELLLNFESINPNIGEITADNGTEQVLAVRERKEEQKQELKDSYERYVNGEEEQEEEELTEICWRA